MPMQRIQTSSAELQSLQDNAARAVDQLEIDVVRPLGLPTSVKTSAYNARFGEFVLADPTGGAFTIKLPLAKAAGAGELITVKNHSGSTNTITITAVGSDEVDGASSATITTARGVVRLLVVGDGAWVTL